MNRNILLGALAAAALLAVLIVATVRPGHETQGGLPAIVFATDWKAQAEHGGFYQALAKGYYREAGLDVTIRQGGPGVNVPQLLATNTAQFGIGSNSFIPLNIVVANAGSKAGMGTLPKDPQGLLTHPRHHIKSIADKKGQPGLVSGATTSPLLPWLQAQNGFSERPPFLTDRNAIQEGYLSSEPYTIEKEGGFKPQVFLLSDYGYPGYAAFVMASDRMIAERPQIVQAFVEASIRGWVDYLYGDPSPANALIRKDNPEMTDDLIAHSIETMKAYGIVDSGDTLTLGIGAMNDARWKAFHDVMSQAGVYPKELDVHRAYTLEFVNHGAGLDLKKQLTGK